MIDTQLAGWHRNVQYAQIRVMLDARSDRARPIDRSHSAETKCLQLVEQKLHVRRYVIGDENERRLLLGVHSSFTDAPAARS
jgi:hypothetical protein